MFLDNTRSIAEFQFLSTFDSMSMQMPLWPILIILFGHWVGDFLLQGSTMAERKSNSLLWLTIHVLIYTATLGVFSFVLFDQNGLIDFLLFNGALHFLTDFLTSKLAAKYKLNPRIFFLVLGFDQLIHTVTLIGSMFFYFGR